jgi:ABC-2 type transport system permease protein
VKSRFWADVWTVLRKEWLEWAATRGYIVQPLVILVVFGVLVPWAAGRLWVESPLIHWLWSWLPLVFSAGLVADTFAGERERDTLEALLASRLPDRAIIFGKAAAVAAYGWAITLFCWISGWLTIWISPGEVTLHQAPALLLGLPVLSFLAAWYVAGVGVLISLRAQSVRQAQQLMSIAMLGSLLLVSLLAGRLLLASVELEVGAVLSMVAAALIVLDAGLLLALLARPQRSEWLIY